MKKKINKYERAIISTLCYSDIFNYPLTFGQIQKYYIGRKTSEEKIYSNILDLISQQKIQKTGDFVYLKGRRKISALRKRREKASASKWEQALKISRLLSKIPTVKMIGVSGSLSMDNAEKSDDIDLFIVTSAGFLWTTRLLVNLTLIFSGKKRGRDDLLAANKICPNMFISEDSLKVSENLFTAHEVSQLKVLINKDETYERFLQANSWVKKYMPNAIIKTLPVLNFKKNSFLSSLDKPFFFIQYLYMRNRKTSEKIAPNLAMFHPQDKTQFTQILHTQRYQLYMNSFAKFGQSQPQIGHTLRRKVTPGY